MDRAPVTPPPVAPKQPGRFRRAVRAVDDVMQVTDLFVAVWRLGGLVVRGVGGLLRVFD